MTAESKNVPWWLIVAIVAPTIAMMLVEERRRSTPVIAQECLRRPAVLRVKKVKLTLTCRHGRVAILEDVETGDRYSKCTAKWKRGEVLDATLLDTAKPIGGSCKWVEVEILGPHKEEQR